MIKTGSAGRKIGIIEEKITSGMEVVGRTAL